MNQAFRGTQVGRISYEILRLINNLPEGQKRAEALALLGGVEADAKFRADVGGRIVYGRTEEDVYACVQVSAGVFERWKTKVTAL